MDLYVESQLFVTCMRKCLIPLLLSVLNITSILLGEDAIKLQRSEGTIQINVLSLNNNNGLVRIALYSSSKTFPKKGSEIRSAAIKPKEKKAIH